ncbi:uncharacterized protein LOC111625856 [Centruroides sculpturatus]|uniref:uncharacterized protein LOC111625856 n=1 Tax=Centruroides sculpturatus TaxID=218467 RepID=UPI000C6CE3F4|nr:uncharacterized protein LOC111625856 [Centruroides sculpturatus]
MLAVRSYSVRMKKRNREAEASFRRSQYRRKVHTGTPLHSPAKRTVSSSSAPTPVTKSENIITESKDEECENDAKISNSEKREKSDDKTEVSIQEQNNKDTIVSFDPSVKR